MSPETVAERLAALLMTAPMWTANYTVSLDTGKWLLAEAGRLGWTIAVEEEREVVAVPVAAVVKPKPVAPDQTGRKRTPEQIERMRQGQLARYRKLNGELDPEPDDEQEPVTPQPEPPPPSPGPDGESPDDRHKRLSAEAASRTWAERHPETASVTS